jgi:3-oxoacyl-[acyl-carrier-protein] synthase-1
MNRPQVAVTGFGINSALGSGAAANTEALKSGRSGIVSIREAWEPHGFRSLVAGDIRLDGLKERFDRKQLRFMCEPALLAAAATADAIAHAGLSDELVQSPDTGVIMGTGAGASITDVLFLCDRLRQRGAAKVGAYHTPIIMGSSLTANVGSVFHIHGHSYSLTSACATSAHAIMLGMDTIRSGRQKRMIVGGSEDVAMYAAGSFDGMNALSSAFNDRPTAASRPLDAARDGFVISGGAGILVLEELETALARGATIHAIVAGAEATCDGNDMVAPSGFGAEHSMNGAIADAGIVKSDIGYVNLHGTSTPIGDAIEVEAVKRVFGGNVPPFSSTKSMTGHALGAAGSIEAIFCLLMMQEKFLAPNINLEDPDPVVAGLPIIAQTTGAEVRYALSNSFGFGGTNCSLVLAHPDTA